MPATVVVPLHGTFHRSKIGHWGFGSCTQSLIKLWTLANKAHFLSDENAHYINKSSFWPNTLAYVHKQIKRLMHSFRTIIELQGNLSGAPVHVLGFSYMPRLKF